MTPTDAISTAPALPTATAPPSATADPVPAPLGRFLVAKPGAGRPWQGNGPATLVLPVYDTPGGDPRTLLEVNAIDGIATPLPIFNWSDLGSPTVLRVVEGRPGDEWVKVQAPTRPHDTTVWVEAADFDWGETDLRIEIDLAGPGRLVVVDGENEVMSATIVQGRDGRETPTHVTYVEAGLLGEVWNRSPAYGHAVLMIASFSEQLGTFGGGGSPQNFIHGTNVPDVLGQRVSSGEIRLSDPDIERLIDLVHPGVPVLLFDSSGARAGREVILARSLTAAETTVFALNAPVSQTASRQHPQLWRTCDEPVLVCANGEADVVPPAPAVFRYAIANDLDSPYQIPVFDEAGAWFEPRTLLDINAIDGTRVPNPLFPRTVFGNPLVLRVLDVREGFLKVQVPTRPNHSHAWVRASEFDLVEPTVFLEISVAPTGPAFDEQAGELLLYDGDELLVRSKIVSGRESRPTALGSGWVTQIVDGPSLGPAYGEWVVGLGLFSEALGTFGGGSVYTVAVHGTNQPDLIGQRVSSGTLRLPAEALSSLAATEGLIGAATFVHDQPAYLDFEQAIDSVPLTQPAETVPFDPEAEQLILGPA